MPSAVRRAESSAEPPASLRMRPLPQLLAALRTRDTFDLVRDFSTPLPMTVIAELLGVESEYLEDFNRWSKDMVLTSSRPTDEAVRMQIQRSNAEMRACLQEAIRQRYKDPKDDLLTHIVQAEDEDQVLSADEILAMAVLLLVAGNEITVNQNRSQSD